MTREEAIVHLEYRKDFATSQQKEALDMAISALSAQNEKMTDEELAEFKKELSTEPCDDAVSRQAVEEIINDIRDCISVEGYWAILERLKKLPSVQKNKGEWIPIESEEKPEDYDRVLITVNSWHGLIVREARYHKAKNEFEVLHNHECWEVGEEGLLAWQPLPEPYKAEKTETCNGCTHPCVMYEPTMKACEKKGR